AQQFHELVVHDLHHLLRRRQRFQHILTDRFHLHPVDEAADDLEVDVGFEEGHPNLAEGLLDVVFAEPALAAQTVEDCGQSCAQRGEHGMSESTELRGTFQLATDQNSAAARSSRMTLAGSCASNTAEPATRIEAPWSARVRACSTFTPPSMETSTARAPSIV